MRISRLLMNRERNGFPISALGRLSCPPSIDRPAVQSNARLCPRHTLPRPAGLSFALVHHAYIAFHLLAGLWPPDERQNRQNLTELPARFRAGWVCKISDLATSQWCQPNPTITMIPPQLDLGPAQPANNLPPACTSSPSGPSFVGKSNSDFGPL